MVAEGGGAYRDPNAAVEKRVEDLLARMTLAEKVGQMAQIDRTVAEPRTLTQRGVGSVLNGGDSGPGRASAQEFAQLVDEMQRWALATRLGIPIFYGTDAVHGYSNLYGATIFPHNVGLGATRDPELVRKIGEVTALEVRAAGVHYAFAPCVAVCKNPRWGRCYESYSEDPDIVTEMTSLVSGLQGSAPKDHPVGYPFLAGSKHVLACAKHFVGDGGTKDGINEGDTICTFEELESVHMKPYFECLAQGVSTVMVSYSSWNGKPMHSHHYLVTDILKNKLGFKGMVISDWEALDRLADPKGSNYRHCISTAVNAGIDMLMLPFRCDEFLDDLISLVESGEIPMSRIDDAVERILRVKFISGIFEKPFSDKSLLDMVGCKEHRELAREAVRKSLVLLKNGKDAEKPLLPLSKTARRILVAGKHADDVGYQCGGWTISWNGSSGPTTIGTTILEGIRKLVRANTDVVYVEQPTTDTLGGVDQDISFAVVVVGEDTYVESTGDRTNLDIPFNGADMIKLVAAKYPTLAIIISGRPLHLDSELMEKADAIVAAWLPGSEGSGVADVIFGDFEFHGTLPVSWFRSMEQLPMNSGDDGYDPLFPVGFGLKMGHKLQNGV